LLKYANQEQDTALLAINTLQKDMSDQNAFIRATALTVMSMIRIPGLTPLCKNYVFTQVVLSINRSLSDLSPLVRRSSAKALINCFKYLYFLMD
jgi:AP-3 complex subunit beta